eukprot:1965197-Pleurochrysis_carterae.AAC.1
MGKFTLDAARTVGALQNAPRRKSFVGADVFGHANNSVRLSTSYDSRAPGGDIKSSASLAKRKQFWNDF